MLSILRYRALLRFLTSTLTTTRPVVALNLEGGSYLVAGTVKM